jgi:ankyrin repeat protein
LLEENAALVKVTSMLSRIIGKIANVADPTLRLAAAVDKGGLASARKALKKGADPNHRDAEGRTLLMVAAFNRDLDLIKLLAEAGADLNLVSEFGNTAMDVASETGDTDIIFYLLGHGAASRSRYMYSTRRCVAWPKVTIPGIWSPNPT